MQNIVLVVHLILALILIALVLLQRSEGGGLGMGGGGGGNSGRPKANPLTKVTWGFAGAFIATSLTLTILAQQGSESASIFADGDLLPPAGTEQPADNGLLGDNLLPPSADDGPALPPAAE